MSVNNGQTAKAFPYSSFIPFYFNGLGISNNATTPNTKLDIAAGSCLDSTGTFQMTAPSAITINAATTGLNALDTGVLVLSTVYAVYLVSDPVTQLPTGAMLSTSLTGPLMPYGYSAWARIGYIATDATVHFLKGYWTDNDSAYRLFVFDAPQATAVTAGASTTYAGVSLAKWVPAFNNLPVLINTAFTPGAASRVLDMQAGNAVGDEIIVTGQVTSVVVTTQSQVLSQLVATVPTINYKVSNAGDAVAINVAGYYFDL